MGLSLFFGMLGVGINKSVDGGEAIFEMPTFQGRKVVNTGVAFHRWNEENNLELWVCDYGAEDESTTETNRDPHIHLMLFDYSASSADMTEAVTPTITRSIRTSVTISRKSLQGIDVDNNGKIWITDYNYLVQIEPEADQNGDAVVLQSHTLPSVDGIAFNAMNNRLIIKIKNESFVREFDLSGNQTNANLLGVFPAIEGITVDDENNMLYGASGGNYSNEGARIRKYNLATGASVWASDANANIQSNEGLVLVKNPDGKSYFYHSSDAEFHPASNALLRKNAIFKLDATIGLNT